MNFDAIVVCIVFLATISLKYWYKLNEFEIQSEKKGLNR